MMTLVICILIFKPHPLFEPFHFFCCSFFFFWTFSLLTSDMTHLLHLAASLTFLLFHPLLNVREAMGSVQSIQSWPRHRLVSAERPSECTLASVRVWKQRLWKTKGHLPGPGAGSRGWCTRVDRGNVPYRGKEAGGSRLEAVLGF